MKIHYDYCEKITGWHLSLDVKGAFRVQETTLCFDFSTVWTQKRKGPYNLVPKRSFEVLNTGKNNLHCFFFFSFFFFFLLS